MQPFVFNLFGYENIIEKAADLLPTLIPVILVPEPTKEEPVTVPETSSLLFGLVEPNPTLLLVSTKIFDSLPSLEIYSALDIFFTVYSYLC